MKPIKTSLPISGFWDTRQGGRAENQDSCGFIDTPLGLAAIVCDGMGGGPSGQLASSTAVQKIVEYIMNAPEGMSRSEVMKNAIEYAHHTILQMGTQKPALRGMGTTVAAVLVNDYSAIIAHVGDSRVYQFRWKRKIFRTADHSMVGELVRNGTLTEEQARLSSQSNIITKALGGNLTNLAEVTERPYEKGDRFMICSDGIWGMMPEKELIRRTAKTPSLSGAVDGTVVEVDEIGRNEGNTHDNLTIAMLEMKKDSKLKEKMSKKSLIIIGILAALFLMSMAANLVLGYFLWSPKDKQQTETTKQELAEKDKQIKTLTDSISKLRGDVVNEKEKAVDAKEKAADAKEKAADAKAEAAERAKAEAEKAKADATAKQSESKPANVANARQDVIAILGKASKFPKAKDRESLRVDAINKLNNLTSMDAAHKSDYNWCITELKKPITLKDNGRGQYTACINKLKAIK
jgi:serine/threonine protein phosphatase PrpC